MENDFLIMRRINTLIDRIKDEEDIECRKIDFVAVRARIMELNERNPGNPSMNRKSEELIQLLKGLAHIYPPGIEDKVYIERIEKAGLVFSGKAPNQPIMQILELPEHPYFIGTQAHPCLTSRPLEPDPMFMGLVAAAAKRHRPEGKA